MAGQAYDLELYWYENGGGAVLQLQYRLSTSDSWITIPASAFIIEDTFSTSSTYDVYAAQVMMGGEIFTDLDFYTLLEAQALLKDWWPLWCILEKMLQDNGGTLILFHQVCSQTQMLLQTIALPFNSSAACDADYNLTYDWMDRALRGTIWEKYFGTTVSYLPEGSSLWWQVFNPAGTGVGLWAQLNFYDTYDGSG